MEEYEEIPLKGQKRDLQDSLDNLTKELRMLHSLFRDAAEDASQGSSDDGHRQILEKLDAVIDQNKKIAEGILAVADLLQKRSMPPQNRMPPPPPPTFMTSGLPPLPQSGLPSFAPLSIPPPPKKGFMK